MALIRAVTKAAAPIRPASSRSFRGFNFTSPSNPTHPLTFKPEFVDAFELGTKNTLLDGAMTFNGDVFYYKYQNYQISQIVDRTSVNLNFNADVKGAEVEATWEPVPGLRFNFAGGYENTHTRQWLAGHRSDGSHRRPTRTGWWSNRSSPQTSNCVLPSYVGQRNPVHGGLLRQHALAYTDGYDPVRIALWHQSRNGSSLCRIQIRFDPRGNAGDPDVIQRFQSWTTAPNNGEGFAKNLSGNQLPNTPPFTFSAGAQYPCLSAAIGQRPARVDGYWQGNSFARVFNDKPYDQLHGYTNVNLTLIFTNQDGWQAMAYMKNVFNTTAITGAFLNSDDTALTTNVFITDPRLFGLRITKNW